jgi:hypothetical protein
VSVLEEVTLAVLDGAVVCMFLVAESALMSPRDRKSGKRRSERLDGLKHEIVDFH